MHFSYKTFATSKSIPFIFNSGTVLGCVCGGGGHGGALRAVVAGWGTTNLKVACDITFMLWLADCSIK